MASSFETPLARLLRMRGNNHAVRHPAAYRNDLIQLANHSCAASPDNGSGTGNARMCSSGVMRLQPRLLNHRLIEYCRRVR